VLQLQGDSFALTDEGERLVAFYARSVSPILGEFPGEILP
jgi:glycerol-3-phosphate O-acyltransferase